LIFARRARIGYDGRLYEQDDGMFVMHNMNAAIKKQTILLHAALVIQVPTN